MNERDRDVVILMIGSFFLGYEGELTIGNLRRAYDVLLEDTVYD